MPSGIRKSGQKRPQTPTLSAGGLPANSPFDPAAPADAALSAAFRHVLGGNAPKAHPAAGGAFSAKDAARQAKADRPGAPHKGTPRKAHIGPRSGHK